MMIIRIMRNAIMETTIIHNNILAITITGSATMEIIIMHGRIMAEVVVKHDELYTMI